MELTAIFESWHLGDGNYPALQVGQLVNLSFEIESNKLSQVDSDTPIKLQQIASAEYAFCGKVLKIYDYGKNYSLIIIGVNEFRFYVMHPSRLSTFQPDMLVSGNGKLVFDHYAWVENVERFSNPPNLFYNLRIKRIRRVLIPERFIDRKGSGKSYPGSLHPGDYSESDVKDIESMWEPSPDEVFYIIDFDDQGLENERIERTFM